MRRKLADGRCFTRSVYPGHENDERFLAGIDLQRPGIRGKRALDFRGEDRLDFFDADILVIAALADCFCDPCRRRDAEIGADQQVFQIVEHRSVELALGEDRGEAFPDRTGRARQALAQPRPPAPHLPGKGRPAGSFARSEFWLESFVLRQSREVRLQDLIFRGNLDSERRWMSGGFLAAARRSMRRDCGLSLRRWR